MDTIGQFGHKGSEPPAHCVHLDTMGQFGHNGSESLAHCVHMDTIEKYQNRWSSSKLFENFSQKIFKKVSAI